jgi:hypothetical protein
MKFLMKSIHLKRARKIVPAIEALESRELLAASLLHGVHSRAIQPVLMPGMELALRHNHAVGAGSETQDRLQGQTRFLVTTSNALGANGNHSASLTQASTSQRVVPAGKNPPRLMPHDGIGISAASRVDGPGQQAKLSLAAQASTRITSLWVKHGSRRPSYDIAIPFSYVGSPGNASVAINGFTPPSEATVPARVPNGSAYQNIGGVPYIYGIGQTEITAGQYVTFLNKVDPNGDNPVQPFTGITLWNNNFSPVLNPFSGEINLVTNAAPGTHYQLAASFWANKPLVNGNLLDFAYFVNSLYNGTTVAVDNRQGKSPLGFHVHLQTRYVNLSTSISTGMYDLADPSYPFFHRLDTSGYVIPSENEWVKAAYYSPLSAGNGTHYYYYPTVSNTPPTALQTGGSTPTVDSLGNVITSNLVRGVSYSNYDKSVIWQPPYDPQPPTNNANVVNVGETRTPSPWLTQDQGGNAVEYTDTAAAPVAGVPNPRDLPAYVKVHGGIANAITYQLWLTATGTSSPYGQALGATDTQGGARFGFVPNAHSDRGIRNSRSVSPSTLVTPLTSNGLVYRLDSLNSLDTLYTADLTTAISLADSKSTYVVSRGELPAVDPVGLSAGVWLPEQDHGHAVLHNGLKSGCRGLHEPQLRQRGHCLHGAPTRCWVHQLPPVLQLDDWGFRLFRGERRHSVFHFPGLHVRWPGVVSKLGSDAKRSLAGHSSMA